MRKQNRAILWPVYFDSTKTREQGRRVSKNLAVPNPKITEIKDAALGVGLEHDIADAGHPKTPWVKTGVLFVKKTEPKEQIVKKIARQLVKTRTQNVPK